MNLHGLERDTRASIRTQTADGVTELVGWVVSVDEDGLRVRTRREELTLRWNQVLSCRKIGVPRGTNPAREPLANLAKLAASAGVDGAKFVARLSQLLDGRTPVRGDSSPALVQGQWAVVADGSELWPAAWTAARADARNILAVSNDPERIAELLSAGFVPAGPR